MTNTERCAKFYKRNPWVKAWRNALRRCVDRKHKSYPFYGGRGVTFELTKEDVRALWERDKAGRMEKPSLDRVDSSGPYSFLNCRFIELSENCSRPRLAELVR